MFCSCAHKKISFRTWFFQMFFNKTLIKCEKINSCLMQYSKKYWKWPETYVLILRSYWTPQFPNSAIPPICLSSHSITQKILLSLHYFLTLQFQTFTKIPHFFFFFEIGRKYVSIIVNIISNNTVLQSDLLWIFVSIRRLLQLIVCIRGLKAPSQKHNSFFFSFLPSPLLNLQTIKAHLFSRFTPSPQKICFNMHLSPKNWIFQWTPMILRTFIINPIPSFKSN